MRLPSTPDCSVIECFQWNNSHHLPRGQIFCTHHSPTRNLHSCSFQKQNTSETISKYLTCHNDAAILSWRILTPATTGSRRRGYDGSNLPFYQWWKKGQMWTQKGRANFCVSEGMLPKKNTRAQRR